MAYKLHFDMNHHGSLPQRKMKDLRRLSYKSRKKETLKTKKAIIDK